MIFGIKKDSHINGELTLEQETELALIEAQTNLEKLRIRQLELETLGVDDFNTTLEQNRISAEIEKYKQLVKDLSKLA